jgi:hypothetical protein
MSKEYACLNKTQSNNKRQPDSSQFDGGGHNSVIFHGQPCTFGVDFGARDKEPRSWWDSDYSQGKKKENTMVKH